LSEEEKERKDSFFCLFQFDVRVNQVQSSSVLIRFEKIKAANEMNFVGKTSAFEQKKWIFKLVCSLL